MTTHPDAHLTDADVERLANWTCVVCEHPLDPDEVEDRGRITCRNACRQARWRAQRAV